jgi:hypothetical protein
MIRWLWSRWTSGLLVMLVAALAAVVTNPVAGLGRADVCADSGAQCAQVGRCADPNSLVANAVPPPEYVAPPREYRKLPPPVNIPHPKTNAQWSTTDSDGPLPQGLWNGGTVQYEVGTYMSDGLQI